MDCKLIKTNTVLCCPLSFCTKQARIVDSNEEGLASSLPSVMCRGFPVKWGHFAAHE
jgi:hypothetical protein